MKSMLMLALTAGTLGISQMAHADAPYACDVMEQVRDSFNNSCAENTYSVVVFVPDDKGALKWNLFEQNCYGSEANANAGLAKARSEGLCK